MRTSWVWLLPVLLLGTGAVFGAGAYHRTPLDVAQDTNRGALLSLTNTALKQLSETTFALGLVHLDKAKGTVSFPATVNMTEGFIEYALVQVSGKVHESVLKTETSPLHIQLAWLLIAPKLGSTPPADAKLPRDLIGPPIYLSVKWRVGEVEKRVRLEELVTNTLTKSPMRQGSWIFNGSRVVEGTFLAERDGSIAAVIADPDAMVNNPRPGRDSDDIWIPNSALVPPVGTPVEVVIEAAQ